MDSEIINHLRLSDASNSKFIFVTKDVMSDINFIYSEILPYYIKNDYAVILLNFAQSIAHYNHLLLKAGVNIRQLRDSEDFVVIDGLCEIEKLTHSTDCEAEENAAFRTLFSDSKGAERVKQLYFCIKSLVQKSIDKSKRFLLFLDDVSVMLNLGLDLNALSVLIQYCRSIITDCKMTPNILLVGSCHEYTDQENVKMVNYLLHIADIRIQVEGLKTGYSKDAHGKITFSVKSGVESMHNEKLLFKVTEKGAKLLTLGL